METVKKLKQKHGDAIWTKSIKNQFIKYIVYYHGYIIGESSTPLEIMEKNILKYYKCGKTQNKK